MDNHFIWRINMKKIKKEELNKANGGCTTDESFWRNCHSCGELMCCNSMNSRQEGEGCDSSMVYQCPKCGAWNNFDR